MEEEPIVSKFDTLNRLIRKADLACAKWLVIIELYGVGGSQLLVYKPVSHSYDKIEEMTRDEFTNPILISDIKMSNSTHEAWLVNEHVDPLGYDNDTDFICGLLRNRSSPKVYSKKKVDFNYVK